MKAIILAGGMGTRLKGVVDDLPKPMAPVGRKPFLEYIIIALAAQGLREIILSVGYRKDVIRSHFEDGTRWGVNIFYSEEDTPLGTGGSVRQALMMSGESHSLILNGDTFNQLDFKEMERHHLSRDCLATIGLRHEDDAGRYGTVRLNEGFEITEFREKSPHDSGYINCGAYIMDTTIVDHMPVGPFSLENDFFPGLIAHGMSGFISHGFFIDIGIPSTYRYISDHCYLLHHDNLGNGKNRTGEERGLS
ncbi:MAG: nucleotidyltransferase family protein [Syntrophorhabdaceae bacterium]|nr:nucleotidyltransferase family protein [Syntrophorhabdaceae bacterium]